MRLIILSLTYLIASSSNGQQWNWAVDAGGGGNVDFCWGIATDSHGNAYWAGSVSGTADFGCGTLTTGSTIAGVLAKYDSTGACQWVRGITVGFNDAWAYGIAIDAADRIYITGSYDGNATFGNGVTLNSLGSDDIFLARYDVDGNCLWARRAGSSGSSDEARSIAVSDSGAVLITGFSGGTTITFDNISIPNPNNYRQIIVARYDSTGTVQWAEASTGNGQGKSARSIAVADDRLFITGQIGGAVTSFDGLAINPDPGTYLYVLACDLQGNALWTSAYGSGDHEGMGIAADTLGDLFITGRLWGTLNLPNDTLVSTSSNDDILLIGMDQDGNYRWAKSTGSTQRDLAWGVEADGEGNAYVSAQFQQTIDFFGTPLTSLGGEDLLVARVTNWGAVTWVKQGGSYFRDIGLCVHRSNVGSTPVYTGGYYFGPATYGASTIDDAGNGDAMLIQLADTTASDIALTNQGPVSDGTSFLFPSPAHDQVNLHVPRQVRHAWLISTSGRTIPVADVHTGIIDVHDLAPGIYTVRLQFADASVACMRFIKE